MINLAPRYLDLVQKILREHFPDREVRIFGSRATAKVKTYSDIDLVVMGESKCEPKNFFALKEAFQESDLPFRVDLLDWQDLSDSFRRVIEKKYCVIQKAGAPRNRKKLLRKEKP